LARNAEQHYNSGTMEIFISWHGKRSHAVAVALRDWLPLIVNAFKPWLSSADIDKGARWRTELATKLGSVTAGIFCLTPGNLTAPWLIYEAGAISRTPEKTYVCTLLVDLQPSDVKDPLAQFQATKATKEDIHQLVKNLNKALGEESMDEALV
jgi:TIR domain